MIITSRSNQYIIGAAALKEKKHRDEQGCFILEGIKLFREAVLSGIKIKTVFATEKAADLCKELLTDRDIFIVSENVFEKLSTEKSPQGVICIAKYIDKIHNLNKIYTMEDFAEKRRILLLSALRDPGNLGTVIRSAAAFGTDELILSSDCADIYNPKTVRAAMGTLFRQKISVTSDLSGTVRAMRAAGYDVYSAVLDENAVRLDELDILKTTAFIIGNEGHGIARDVVGASGKTVFIPMNNHVESLNAAAAAAVFMWQSMISENKFTTEDTSNAADR